MRIMAVIMCHNSPDTTDRLHRELLGVVDELVVIDSGSEELCKPVKTKEVVTCGNLYWTGCWDKAFELFNATDCEVLWVIGGDIELRSPPREYRKAIESAWPFGCWHPVVDGISRPLMQASHHVGNTPWSVWHLEGIAMAVSRAAVHEIQKMPSDNKYGWGLDIWMCWKCWKSNQRNVLDNRVKIFHPDLRGYSSGAAHQEMFQWFDKHVGGQWRDELHYWSDDPSYNRMSEAGKLYGVSVVITSYNQKQMLILALESFLKQETLPVEIIVSDDGSTDGTLEWLDSLPQNYYPFDVRYLTREHNGYNLAGAYNAGAALVRGERIIFTNADVIHNRESVTMHLGLETELGSGRVGVIPLPVSKAMTREDINDGTLRKRADDSKYVCDARVRGGNFSVPVDIFRELGGFSNSYAGKYGSETADLIERAKVAGHKLSDIVDSCGFHLAHPSRIYKEQQLGNKQYRKDYLGVEA